MNRKSFHIWLLVGELWLVLAGLYAHAEEFVVPTLSGEVQAQCPGGMCPQPQYPRQVYTQPATSRNPQQSPEADYHAGIAKVYFGNAGGSGTLIETDGNEGTVITSAHVIEGQPATGRLVWPSGETTGASVVGADIRPDLAVLRCYLPKSYAVVPLAERDEYAKQGDTVEICGYRANYQGRMCHFFARCLGYANRDSSKADQIKVDAQTVSGDSGGPIIYRGKVVAVLWGFTGGIDGTRAETQGACCIRIRKFLSQFGVRLRQSRAPPQDAAEPPLVPVIPGPVDEAPPADQQGCQCGPDCGCKANELAALSRELEAAKAKHGSILDRLRTAESKPAEIKHVPGPVKEVIVEKIVPAAATWLSGKAIALAAGFGVPGWAAAIGIWFAKRRIGKRLKQWEGGDLSSAASGLQVERDGLVAQVKTLREQIHRLTTDRANPVVITRDNPIPPQLVAENREYVPVEVPQLEYEAMQWAIDDYIKRNPTHRALFEQIDAVAKQYVSGRRNRRAAKVQ